MKQEDFDKNKKQFEVDDTPVLVADPLTRIGYPGFYREHHRPEGTGGSCRASGRGEQKD